MSNTSQRPAALFLRREIWLRLGLRKVAPWVTKRVVEMIQSELNKAYSAGYDEGHEQQMRMRILDQQERR